MIGKQFFYNRETNVAQWCHPNIETRLGLLQRNMIEVISSKVESGLVGLGAWNNEYSLFNGGEWVSAETLESAKCWIKNLLCHGWDNCGTCLGQALDGALGKYHCKHRVRQCTDVYILTDGAMDNFDVDDFSHSLAKWARYRAKYPNVTFHFIAIGEAARADISELLQRMAEIGNGNFTQCINSEAVAA